jgi:CspA family cold shock protein
MSSNNDVTTSTTSERFTGRVKWFNNKSGYGFITVTDGSRTGTDVFVHHSAVNTSSEQYKYLVQGEYVDFAIVNTSSGKHEFQASEVSGIKGGKLMCETRNEFKATRVSYKLSSDEHATEQVTQQDVKMPRQRVPRSSTSVPRARGEGPREGHDNKEWSQVKASAPVKARRGRPPKQSVNV